MKLIWGEPEPGTEKTTVEPSRQMEIRVRVSKVPFLQRRPARATVDSWRTPQERLITDQAPPQGTCRTGREHLAAGLFMR